jgi:drug/metabolite transporter (DMT)-like permease
VRTVVTAGLLPSVGEVLDGVQSWVTDHVSEHVGFLFSPLLRWYVVFALFVGVLGLLEWFLGWSKFARIGISVLLALGAAMMAGGHLMYRTMEERARAEHAKLREMERVKREADRTTRSW